MKEKIKCYYIVTLVELCIGSIIGVIMANMWVSTNYAFKISEYGEHYSVIIYGGVIAGIFSMSFSKFTLRSLYIILIVTEILITIFQLYVLYIGDVISYMVSALPHTILSVIILSHYHDEITDRIKEHISIRELGAKKKTVLALGTTIGIGMTYLLSIYYDSTDITVATNTLLVLHFMGMITYLISVFILYNITKDLPSINVK